MNYRIQQNMMVFTFIVMNSLTVFSQSANEPAKSLPPVIPHLEKFIEHEMRVKQLPAVSIAIVDGPRIIWSRGFGQARKQTLVPAKSNTVYRVGSVSKLFTDLAVMQLVEKGLLDLDAPVTKYLSDFAPKNPFSIPITLRHLMSHRAGLVRESPVGHYFDPTNPSLQDTVLSLNETELVVSPGTRTKYSNAGIAVVGRVIEKITGKDFVTHVQTSLLDPMKLPNTSFIASERIRASLADGLMWTYDGRSFPAPQFPLGTSPAGNLYSTVDDLGQFIMTILEGGRGVIKPQTLKAMWRPQFKSEAEDTGFGLGFNISKLDGHRTVGHNGAVYGFATELTILPDDGLGVAVIISKDCANSPATRIGNLVLRSMLAHRLGESLPSIDITESLDDKLPEKLAGRYSYHSEILDFIARDNRLYFQRPSGGMRTEVRRNAQGLICDDILGFGPLFKFDTGSVSLGDKTFTKLKEIKPPSPPSKWNGLIGEYGWDHNTLYILEQDGKLYALIEWFFYDRLEEISPDVFRFPQSGLYAGETLHFKRDSTGRATEVNAASVRFVRRKIDGDDGTTFRITPLRSVAELRGEASKVKPHQEQGLFLKSELVDITTLDPTIKLDIRYATTNNFLSTPFYSTARAFLQRPAAEALIRINQSLKSEGYGLLIHDAYRPWQVTKMFWDATPESSRAFVADPAKGSKHNRGCAVDLTLYELATGRVIEMVGGYDEFSTRSSPDYPGGTSIQRWHRERLRKAMEAQGFTVNEVEWWHFDYRDWSRYPILNETFEQLLKTR
jgi:CubicO group peptidase (beta-lactamase class C family)/D-alanyl-D-alanine dipeptidase